jgi:hypothetical protein
MSPLKAFILSELHQRGPMRDVDLWQHSTVSEVYTVTVACVELQQEGYIDHPSGIRPLSFDWQLTEKGKEVAANFSGGARV